VERYSFQFENKYFTEMCSSCEAGSYLRRVHFVYHSTLGLRVTKKKKKMLTPIARRKSVFEMTSRNGKQSAGTCGYSYGIYGCSHGIYGCSYGIHPLFLRDIRLFLRDKDL